MEDIEKVEGETLETPAETPEEKQEGGDPIQQPEISLEDLKALQKKAAAYDAQKIRAEKAEREAALAKQQQTVTPQNGLNVNEYIEISTSLDGLDPVEKARLVKEAQLQGKPLSEARTSEDFVLWQQAYKNKVETERALHPSSAQANEPAKKSFVDKLNEINDPRDPRFEEALAKAGLYKSPKPRVDVRHIGDKQTL